MEMFRNVGLALRLLREFKGLNQAALARQAGIGKGQLSKYENGKEVPKLDSLEKMLKALEVSQLDFFYTVHLIDGVLRKDVLRQELWARVVPPLPHSKLFPAVSSAIEKLLSTIIELHTQLLANVLLPAGRQDPAPRDPPSDT